MFTFCLYCYLLFICSLVVVAVLTSFRNEKQNIYRCCRLVHVNGLHGSHLGFSFDAGSKSAVAPSGELDCIRLPGTPDVDRVSGESYDSTCSSSQLLDEMKHNTSMLCDGNKTTVL